MYDYGNARIAARRGKLLDDATLDSLAASGSAAAVVSSLERNPAWAELMRRARQVTSDPAGALELAIERFRADELTALPAWYSGEARRLVEALVMDLDRERLVAILRRRAAGQRAEAINPTIVRGALLDDGLLGALSRVPTAAALMRGLGRAGIMERSESDALARAAPRAAPDELEVALGRAWHRARLARADGGTDDARRVRRIVEDEHADRVAVEGELATSGVGAAALVERTLRLSRLRRVARLGRRDPGGIGAVAGYVAAVELQALGLRTALARVAGGWSAGVARSFLAEAG